MDSRDDDIMKRLEEEEAEEKSYLQVYLDGEICYVKRRIKRCHQSFARDGTRGYPHYKK